MKLFAATLLLLLSCHATAETCSYGKVDGSVMISNLPLSYGKKGACFGATGGSATVNAGKKNKAAPLATAPADFPRVDAATQQQRDTGRRSILNAELNAERSALQQAQSSGKSADIALHEKNIKMLEKEISSIK